jgi:hypothetical protein
MYRKICFSLLVIVSLTSCRRALDITPENSLTFKNALKSPNSFEAALRGADQYLKSAIRREHLIQAYKGEFGVDYYPSFPQRLLDKQSIATGEWGPYYLVISQANIVLKFADQADMPAERKSVYKGQAYFYKAIAYFELLRQYGDCVLVPDEVSVDPLPKTSWAIVSSYAIEMAQKAVELLPELDQLKDYNGAPAQFRSAPARGAANALLAHLCAWKAGTKYFSEDQSFDENLLWQRAEQAASAVMASSSYSLAANPEQVVTGVLVGDHRESVFETVFKGLWHEVPVFFRTNAVVPGLIYQTWPVVPNSSPTERSSLGILNTTVKAMFTGNDLRKNAYFYNFEEMAKPANILITQGFAYPNKWRQIVVETEGWNAGRMVNYNVNRIWWRLADIILLRAECRARLNNNGGAIADLDLVRARANATPYSVVEHNGDLRYTIFKEREKELLMEGYRYYDVIRNGYVRTELDGGFKTLSDQDMRDGALFLAITNSPFGGTPSDFVNNPLMRQNKYWSKYL